MRAARHRTWAIVFLIAAAAGSATPARSLVLDVPPVTQQTPVWCWLAVGEMLFRHLQVPAVNHNYQCGIIGAMSLSSNQSQCARDCMLCKTPAGDKNRLMGMLVEYPLRAALLADSPAQRVFIGPAGALADQDIAAELDAHRPIIIGINPRTRPRSFAGSEHVAMIIGYIGYIARSGMPGAAPVELIVNDPFPFSPVSWPDPYIAAGAQKLQAGQYRISRDVLVEELGWTESFLVRIDGRHDPAASVCVTTSVTGTQSCLAAPRARAGEACSCHGAVGRIIRRR